MKVMPEAPTLLMQVLVESEAERAPYQTDELMLLDEVRDELKPQWKRELLDIEDGITASSIT